MDDWRAHLTAMIGVTPNADDSTPDLYRTFLSIGVAIFAIYIIFRCRSSGESSSGPKVAAPEDATDVGQASDANKNRDPGSGSTTLSRRTNSVI